jgi:hypothetical protein
LGHLIHVQEEDLQVLVQLLLLEEEMVEEYHQEHTFQIQEDLEVAEVTEWEAEQETNHLYHHLKEIQEHLLYRIQQERLTMEKVEAEWVAKDLTEMDLTEAQEAMVEHQIF